MLPLKEIKGLSLYMYSSMLLSDFILTNFLRTLTIIEILSQLRIRTEMHSMLIVHCFDSVMHT
jgi:hypothetical protein